MFYRSSIAVYCTIDGIRWPIPVHLL